MTTFFVLENVLKYKYAENPGKHTGILVEGTKYQRTRKTTVNKIIQKYSLPDFSVQNASDMWFDPHINNLVIWFVMVTVITVHKIIYR